MRVYTEALRELIVNSGLSQTEIAQKVGTSKSTVSYIVRRRSVPSFEVGCRILVALGVDMSSWAEKLETIRTAKDIRAEIINKHFGLRL